MEKGTTIRTTPANSRMFAGTSIILAVLAIAPQGTAGEETNKQENSGWSVSASFGTTVTRGNSKTLLSNNSIVAERKGGDIEARIGVEANYGEAETAQTNGTKTTAANVNNARFFSEVRKKLSDRTYLYSKGDALTDRPGGIDFRMVIGPGAGYYFLKDKKNELSTDLGVTYLRETSSDTTKDEATLRVSERYDLAITRTAKLWETVEYLPVIDDMKQFLLNAEAGLEVEIITHLAMRLVAQEKYNSDAPAGKEKNDLTIISGITVKF